MLEEVLRRVLPHRIVHRNDYMVRFFLWGSRGDGDDGRAVRLHHIKSSDDDRAYHDHPYPFRSFILWGGYTETTPDENGNPIAKRFGMLRWNTKGANDFHRLELHRPAWTLIFTGPREKSWGFWSGKQGDPVVDWRDYGAA